MVGDLRPAIHFCARAGSLNDPNGLVHLDGEYHLFHQLALAGRLHWGHAVSTDLVRWEHLPVALHPDEHGHVFSGCAVVDTRNCSGLGSDGAPPLVAFFTYHSEDDDRETQAVAWSTDGGRSFTKYAGNPVIENPGLPDFRDPKVFWHEESAAWVMVLAAGDHVRFQRSEDLLHWQHVGSWGADHGAHGGVWECPDLFELAVEGSDEARWVLSVSVSDGAPAGGSGMQYFLGHFDGTTFVNDNPPTTVLWQSWGADFYAGVTWEGVPGGRRLMIAWADDPRYRWELPTRGFRGQLTVVRELTLRRGAHGPRLAHTPVQELVSLRGQAVDWPEPVATGLGEIREEPGAAYEIVVAFDASRTTAIEFGVDVHVGVDEWTRIGFDRVRRVAFVDRSRTQVPPHPDFPRRHEAPVETTGGRAELRILVDGSIVEVFTGEGEQLVDLVLPSAGSHGFRLFAVDGEAAVERLVTYPLSDIWPDSGRS